MNEIEEEMRKIAEEKGVEPTEYLPKIARAREMMKIGIEVCPCDAKDKERGCISAKCMEEIQKKGICHCKAFRKKEQGVR